MFRAGGRERIGQRSESRREDKETVSIASMLGLVKVALGGRGGEAEKGRLKETGDGQKEGMGSWSILKCHNGE